MQTQTPIKRSRQLAPLSREHHQGLLFVWKLEQGLRNNTPVEVLRDFCNWYWKQHINPHFGQEEFILLRHLPSDHKLALQLKDEHDDIREMILSIDIDPDKETVKRLADFLEKHIRFEERELFNHFENILTTEQLDSIYRQLEERPMCSIEWSNEFWSQ